LVTHDSNAPTTGTLISPWADPGGGCRGCAPHPFRPKEVPEILDPPLITLNFSKIEKGTRSPYIFPHGRKNSSLSHFVSRKSVPRQPHVSKLPRNDSICLIGLVWLMSFRVCLNGPWRFILRSLLRQLSSRPEAVMQEMVSVLCVRGWDVSCRTRDVSSAKSLSGHRKGDGVNFAT
jgi:hypothetical protein